MTVRSSSSRRAANYSRLWLLVAVGMAACGRTAGTAGRWARHRRDRDRGGRGERPRQAARAQASSVAALASHADPHAALDVVSLRSQRRRVRVRHRRLRGAAGPGAGARAVGAAPSPTRACTPAFTTRATSRPAPRSGSARRHARHARAAVGPPTTSCRVRAGGCRAVSRSELNPGRTLGAGRARRCAPISARGCERTSSPVSCWPRSSFRRAWPTPSWPGCRRSPASTRRSPAWSATRCSGPRGCSCSDPTPRSRR